MPVKGYAMPARYFCRLLLGLALVVGVTAPTRLLADSTAAPASSAVGNVREQVIPLDQGRVAVNTLVASIGRELSMPAVQLPAHKLDLSGDAGKLFCRQLTDALSPGCEARIDGQSLRIRLDPSALPNHAGSIRRACRLLLTGTAALPDSEYGLLLPKEYDPAQPLVVLIHGLDSHISMWDSLANLLRADGHQVASFKYPDDGPIAEAGFLLADALADHRVRYPGAKPFRIIGHSMGGLVGRHYIEGAGYRGDVDKLIMLGTPNHGSDWTSWRWATEWHAHYKACKRDGNWTWSRLSDDGNGEAADDLKPGSEFLMRLNALPRRDGVQYTIVAGNRNAVREVGAEWLDCTAGWIPDRATNWWGFRHTHEKLKSEAKELRRTESGSDGPVTVDSCKLDGVNDMVVVPSDHTGLVCGAKPAGWDVIRERLKN